jgi:hypothetical protein
MPSWKKVIVSGSDANLNSLNITTNLSASAIDTLTLVANSITGSLEGTSSFATSASYAQTASFALNAGANVFPFTGSAEISGSLRVTDRVGIGIDIPTERRIDVDGGEVRIGQSTTGTGAWLSVNLRNGTTAPAAGRFAIRSSASDSEIIPVTQPNLILSRGSDGLGTLLKFTNARAGFAGIGSAADADNLHDIRFYSGDGGERIRVTSLGDVGIGTTSPSAKLHVNGNVSASSYTGSLQGTASFAITSSFATQAGSVNFTDIQNKPTLVSSSAQINLAEATGTATSSLTASLALNVSGSSGRVLYNSANNTTATSENLEFDGTNLTVGGQLNASTKSFVIKHQRIPDKKLVYGVSEGPEHSVFIRGKLSGTNQIILPEEWDWLVDLDSLSVQLTPIGKYQKLYVDSIDGLVITVGNDNLMSKNINCFYLIHATRKDVAPLQTVI